MGFKASQYQIVGRLHPFGDFICNTLSSSGHFSARGQREMWVLELETFSHVLVSLGWGDLILLVVPAPFLSKFQVRGNWSAAHSKFDSVTSFMI